MLVVLIVLWIIDHSHNNKPQRRDDKRSNARPMSAINRSSGHDAQPAPGGSERMAVATPYHKPGHVKVINAIYAFSVRSSP